MPRGAVVLMEGDFVNTEEKILSILEKHDAKKNRVEALENDVEILKNVVRLMSKEIEQLQQAK